MKNKEYLKLVLEILMRQIALEEVYDWKIIFSGFIFPVFSH